MGECLVFFVSVRISALMRQIYKEQLINRPWLPWGFPFVVGSREEELFPKGLRKRELETKNEVFV